MQISKLLTGQVIGRAKTEGPTESARRGKSGEKRTVDKVNISSEAKTIHTAMKAAEGADDIRVDKVNEIKGLIERGEYKIDTQKIAKKIVEEEPDFFLRRR